MKRVVNFKVNGRDFQAEVEPRELLVHALRDKLRLTGTHIGCLTGNCGACTILLNGVAVKSCLKFAVQADGQEIFTIEGMAENGKLHPLQQAFWDNHALQCGYCTPGMILSAYALLSKNAKPTEAEIRRGLSGNLCRCTGYVNIIKAIQDASRRMQT